MAPMPSLALGEPRCGTPAAPSPHRPPVTPGPVPSVGLLPSGTWSALGSTIDGRPRSQATPSLKGAASSSVPVEVANQQLWAVTTEYENLLRLQREHQLLTAQRREAEVRHLRTIADMLSGEATEDDSIAARMRARDEEVTMNQKAKQAELELLGAVLVLRDRQIGELQRLCEAKRSQVRRLHQSGASQCPDEVPGSPHWSDIERLRARALQMESAVTEKRGELRTLAGTLDAKTQRLAELQAQVAEAEGAVGRMPGASLPRQDMQKEKLKSTAAAVPMSNMEAKVEAMREQLANAQVALGQMVRSHVENDNLVRGLAPPSPTTALEEQPILEVGDSSPHSGSPAHQWSSVLERLGLSEAPPSPDYQDYPLVEISHHSRLSITEGGAEESSTSPSFQRTSLQSTGNQFNADVETPLVAPSRTAVDEPWHLYRPHADDALDAVVADFVNQPRNRLRRALFCRTAEGQYFYGTQRIVLRVEPQTGELEAKGVLDEEAIGGEKPLGWAPIEDFARRLERAQSNRLRRARDRAMQ